jgi:group I intron endonuclease
MGMKKKEFIVYCITNLVNGRMYIGKCQYGITVRWNRHVREAIKEMSGCTYLAKAIRKYGRENFKIEEIARAEDDESQKALEAAKILEFNTLAPNGYNLLVSDKKDYRVSEETRQKYRNNFYNNLHVIMQGEDYRDRRSRAAQGKSLNNKDTGRYTGVFWNKDKKRWYAKIVNKLKTIRLGYYDSEETAAEAYDIAAIKSFGADCKLNFPEKKQLYLGGYTVTRREKPIPASKYIGVVRFKRGLPAWQAIAISKTGKHFTKVFREKDYQDAELEAHLWREAKMAELRSENNETA